MPFLDLLNCVVAFVTLESVELNVTLNEEQ